MLQSLISKIENYTKIGEKMISQKLQKQRRRARKYDREVRAFYPSCQGRRKVRNHGARHEVWRNPCATKTNKTCLNCGLSVCLTCQKSKERHSC